MFGPETYFAVMGMGLIAYALTGGADFGGGVWDLLASGPRKAEQRQAVERAIAPIWEANHVWVIFVIVLMFTVFPKAFAAIGISLHIPITLALVGIVLRGASFTFRAYGMSSAGLQRTWGQVFAWSSLVTPVLLGVTVGALSTGDIRLDAGGQVTSGFVAGWLSPFAWLVGLLALTLSALLAAVYLTAEAKGALQEDFRRRALVAEGGAGAMAGLAFLRAASDAPRLYANLAGAWWTIALQVGAAAAAFATIGLLWVRKPRLARFTVAAQVGLVVLGWGLAMDGHLILPDLPLEAAGARPEVLEVLPWALLGGAALLLPALWYLFRVFKATPTEE